LKEFHEHIEEAADRLSCIFKRALVVVAGGFPLVHPQSYTRICCALLKDFSSKPTPIKNYNFSPTHSAGSQWNSSSFSSL
jgi:hypothetical protein